MPISWLLWPHITAAYFAKFLPRYTEATFILSDAYTHILPPTTILHTILLLRSASSRRARHYFAAFADFLDSHCFGCGFYFGIDVSHTHRYWFSYIYQLLGARWLWFSARYKVLLTIWLAPFHFVNAFYL
jgi:hypothetical protein